MLITIAAMSIAKDQKAIVKTQMLIDIANQPIAKGAVQISERAMEIDNQAKSRLGLRSRLGTAWEVAEKLPLPLGEGWGRS